VMADEGDGGIIRGGVSFELFGRQTVLGRAGVETMTSIKNRDNGVGATMVLEVGKGLLDHYWRKGGWGECWIKCVAR